MVQTKNSSLCSKPAPKWWVRAIWCGIALIGLLGGFWVALIYKVPAAEKLVKEIARILMVVIMIAAFLHMIMYESYAAATYEPEVVLTTTNVQSGSATASPYIFDTSHFELKFDDQVAVSENDELILSSTATAISTNDVVSWSTNNGATYVTLTDGNTHLVQNLSPNIVSWFTNSDGKVYAVDAAGFKYPVQNLAFCPALILTVIIIIVVVYIVVKIAQCAKKLLNKTNAPPAGGPQPGGDPGDTFTGNTYSRANASTANMYNDAGLPLLRLPEGITPVFTNYEGNLFGATTTNAGWTDWQGNLITSQTLLCLAPTNFAVGDKFMHTQTSTNLVDWASMVFYISIWESSIPGPNGSWIGTNMIMVNYDQDMMPFATNWYSLKPKLGDSEATHLGGVGDFPRYKNERARFFRVEVK